MSDPEFQRRLRETFQAEAADHLRALAADMGALETGTPEEQLAAMERIFRETHTLKGASRMVGELDAESLCHTLEQRLAASKQRAAPPTPADAAAIRQAIEEIAGALNVTVGPPEVSAPTPSHLSAGAGPASEPRVRVAGGKLDALLLRAEELVSTKLSGAQHLSGLAAVAHRRDAWKRELDRVRGGLTSLHRHADALRDATVRSEMAALLHYVDWTNEYLRELHGDIGRLHQAMASDQRRLGGLVEQLLGDTKELLMLPFSTLLEAFPAFVRDVAERQHKQVDFRTEGAATEIDRRVLDEIRDALLHLVRNAIDHGAETASERRALGKPERARLTIAVAGRAGGTVEITVSDDGRGIDPAAVSATARRLGLLADDAPELRDSDALALLFQSGFSTRTEATNLSGRGLGLAIVRERTERIGGSITLESEPGKGTTFRIHVPLTLARFHGLFVSAQKHEFVVPAAYVRRVIRRRAGDLLRVKNRSVVDVDGSSIAVLRLSEALGLASGAEKNEPESMVFLAVLESGRSQIALQVDDVPYEEEVVMKGIGMMLKGARHYIGATIVGGGRVVPVLNAGHLLAASVFAGTRQRPATSPPATRAEKSRRTILVVEDSITSRSLLKNILQSAGFDVRTAVDGADAMTVLRFEHVDLVISDVQMPRVDGFELTSRIRRDPALSALPVVLITSLASREDRERGVDAGANAYVIKSNFDQSDLLETIRRLLP